jgi:hypothetical protein
MPPRYAYWTILAGGLPTAFRAAEREDLLPTFKRIQEKHPDAEMKYFARGRIWDSPEAARAAKEEQSRGRGREWRPGGEHRDPRQPFKDAKKARNQERRRERFDRKNRPDWRSKERPPRENRPGWRPEDRPPREKPHGDPLRRPARPRSFDRPRFPRAQGSDDQWPPRPPRPDREPRPEREPRREREPRHDRERRPHEPATPPSGPPERGRPFKPRPRPHGPRPMGQQGPKGPKGPKRRS